VKGRNFLPEQKLNGVQNEWLRITNICNVYCLLSFSNDIYKLKVGNRDTKT
jgi:hypothetical protein